MKPTAFKKLPYRNNVSCVVFKNKKFLLVQQVKWPENFWKFPQGGVNDGETAEEAGHRELLEELGTDKFRFIAKSSYTNTYNWKNESVKLAGFRWRGQIQVFFLVEYLGDVLPKYVQGKIDLQLPEAYKHSSCQKFCFFPDFLKSGLLKYFSPLNVVFQKS